MTQNSPVNPTCKACTKELGTDSLGNKNGYELLACESCGSVTVAPWPTEQELIEFYQSYEGTTDYTAKRDKKIERSKKRVARLQRMTSRKKFLDVGCNYGFAVEAARQLGLDAHGIDIDATAVKAAQKSFGEKHYSITSVQDYAQSGKKADILYTSEVIEHVPDPESFVKSMASILNKGGLLYLTTPDGNHFSLPHDFTKWEACMPPEHIVYFSRKGIENILKRHGFKIKKFFFSFKPGIRLIAIKT